MDAYRPDRVVRLLTIAVSIAYFAMWAGAVVVLVGAPVGKVFAGGNLSVDWALKVPVAMDSTTAVHTRWGTAQIAVKNVQADLRLPVATMPWWLVTVLWSYAAAMAALGLLAVYELRRIFQRVRDGAPFDAHNALRMRSVGLLLLAMAILKGIVEFVTSLVVREGLTNGNLTVATGLHIDLFDVLVALGLVALAEIFRRGAELEVEQSLVI